MTAGHGWEPDHGEPGHWRHEAAPGWYAWKGVRGTGYYARRPNTSPPKVVRAASLDGLITEIDHLLQGVR